MTDARTKAIAEEARRQEESCLYTSTSLYLWLRQVRLQKQIFVVAPIILGAIAGFSAFKDQVPAVLVASLTLLASLFPALADALKITTSVDEITASAATFKALQDRFRRLATITVLSDVDAAESVLGELMDRMDVARSNSITPPERYFTAAQAKIKSGDYDFSVDLTGNSQNALPAPDGSSALKRIAVGNLVASASNVAMFADKMARATEHLSNRDSMQLDPQDLLRTYLMSLASLTDTAEWLALPATLAAAGRCKAAFDRLRATNGVINKKLANELVTNSHQLCVALSDELEKHHAYIVAPPEGELIDSGIGMFGLEVVNALPAIRRDVADAARCRAYELWTASVMHMMRVAEVGVAALADHLGTARGSSWGVTIANVQQALDQQRKAKGDPDLKQWASETATYLNFVKDGFRNPAMHPDTNFDREQAISIYDNTRAFMRQLLQRVASPAT